MEILSINGSSGHGSEDHHVLDRRWRRSTLWTTSLVHIAQYYQCWLAATLLLVFRKDFSLLYLEMPGIKRRTFCKQNKVSTTVVQPLLLNFGRGCIPLKSRYAALALVFALALWISDWLVVLLIPSMNLPINGDWPFTSFFGLTWRIEYDGVELW